MGISKRSTKSQAQVQSSTTNNAMTNSIFDAYETQAPEAQTPTPSAQPTSVAMYKFDLNFSKTASDKALRFFHNGGIRVNSLDNSTFFWFTFKTAEQGAVRMSKVLPDGTVKAVDVDEIFEDWEAVTLKGDFRDHKGHTLHHADAADYLEEAKAISIYVPVDAFSDEGENKHSSGGHNLKAVTSHTVVHYDTLGDNMIPSEEVEALFPTTDKTKSGPTAENLRRRWKKANKKAAVQAAVEAQSQVEAAAYGLAPATPTPTPAAAPVVATPAPAAPAPAPVQAPVVDTEKEALRKENAELREQLNLQSQQLNAMQQQLAMLCERLNAPAVAPAPVVETPVIEAPAPQPEVEEEPIVEPEVEEPEIEEVEEVEAPSEKKAALLNLLNGAKNYEPAALESVETDFGGVTIDFDEE